MTSDPEGQGPRTTHVGGLVDTSPIEHGELMERAVQASHSWAATPGYRRANVLRGIAEALDREKAHLVEIADVETWLGTTRLTGEVVRTTAQLRMFAEVIEHGAHVVQPGVTVPGHTDGEPTGPELRRCHLPVGPVAVYAASNFPFAFSVAGGDTASALAAGCPVVVKAHPAHPELSLRTARIIDDAVSTAGVDPGVFALVSGMEEGTRLVQDPVIRAAAFTGSSEGGRSLADLAAARPDPIPFYGEFGSVNPVFVLPEAVADVPGFVTDYLDSLTLGGGQFCTNPGLLIVPRQLDLLPEIARQITQRPAAALLHAGIQAAFTAKVDQLRTIPGVTVHESQAPVPAAGFHVRPVVLTAGRHTATHDRALLEQEVFGPAGVVVEYEDADELLALCAGLKGCLVSSIHAGTDSTFLREVIREASRLSGRVVWNSWPTGVAVATGQHHGGPVPATSNPFVTSVGPDAIMRFLRPITFQNLPLDLLPPEAQR
ncbi:MAG: aldehyde dehydrogenase family protein [Mycolicibacterium mageritense]|uniref:NADP-dependent fatty aldehyde dehydrogenase n=2 Tax=Mycolicibacterium mageritense TaxID=53462 RepID=A0AAI8XNH4_MYCME|nr:MAG: aldehyde dehydrogenase family protein [Mycolicibacterium mageritense]BDY28798.1 NADP-dependent fatty aldehyde dehydrogenase [Mycolicibacterium mageritense]CDO22926.1 aldehyde dehydrogenase [Mycolicibacterium mageritense DSM 44476 = CIP 104973]